MKKAFFMFIILFNGSFLFGQSIMNIYESNGTVVQIPIDDIDSFNYVILNTNNLASVSTLGLSSISTTAAFLNGEVTSINLSPIIERGICFSTSPNASILSNVIANGTGTGVYTCHLTNLLPNTTYYANAYAINNEGTAYGNEFTFTTPLNGIVFSSTLGNGVTDLEGHFYRSVVLNNGQEWMADNLRSGLYANGDSIKHILATSMEYDTTFVGAWLSLNDDTLNDAPYGKYYNQHTVLDPRNVCPANWHTPTLVEWRLFMDLLGPNAGSILKETGTNYWFSPNTDAQNSIHFNAVGSGYYDGPQNYNFFIHQFAYYWTTGGDGNGQPYSMVLYHDNQGFYKTSLLGSQNHISIRCVKD